MLEDTLKKMEQIIERSRIGDNRKEELSGLMGDLREELHELADTHEEHAQSIAGFAKVSSFEATRDAHDEELVSLSLKGLDASVKEFESSHAKLVDTINSICVCLSNLGI